MDKAFSYIQNGIKEFNFPDQPKYTRIRSILNKMIDRLDQDLGIDTTSVRADIMKEYEAKSQQIPQNQYEAPIRGSAQGSQESGLSPEKYTNDVAFGEKPKLLEQGNVSTGPGRVLDQYAQSNTGPGIKQDQAPTEQPPKAVSDFQSRVLERLKEENPDLTGDPTYTPISLKQDAEQIGEK